MKFFMGRMGVNASHSFHGLDPQVAVVGIFGRLENVNSNFHFECQPVSVKCILN